MLNRQDDSLGRFPGAGQGVRWQSPLLGGYPSIHNLLGNSGSIQRHMRQFECNAPDIEGYTVAVSSRCVLDILPRRRGSPNLKWQAAQWYRNVEISVIHNGHQEDSVDITWLFVPINAGELLTSIDSRFGEGHDDRGSFADLVVSLSRSFAFCFFSSSLLPAFKSSCSSYRRLIVSFRLTYLTLTLRSFTLIKTALSFWGPICGTRADGESSIMATCPSSHLTRSTYT